MRLSRAQRVEELLCYEFLESRKSSGNGDWSGIAGVAVVASSVWRIQCLDRGDAIQKNTIRKRQIDCFDNQQVSREVIYMQACIETS